MCVLQRQKIALAQLILQPGTTSTHRRLRRQTRGLGRQGSADDGVDGHGRRCARNKIGVQTTFPFRAPNTPSHSLRPSSRLFYPLPLSRISLLRSRTASIFRDLVLHRQLYNEPFVKYIPITSLFNRPRRRRRYICRKQNYVNKNKNKNNQAKIYHLLCLKLNT